MSLMNALDDFLTSTQIIIIRGAPADAERWAREVGAVYAPSRMIFAIPNDAADLPPALATKAGGPDTTAYVCTGMTCAAPVADLRTLAAALVARRSL